jgi:6-phosphogluconolactonase (cycloisomerase 2 family)
MTKSVTIIFIASLLCAAVLAAPLRHTRARKSTPHEFVYVNCGDIQQFRVGDDGGLVPLNPFAVPGGSGSAYVFLSPSHRYAYALDNDYAAVYQYRVQTDGRLAPLRPPTVSSGRDPEYMTFSHDGRAAYVANLLSNTISQYHIAADGALEPMRPAQVLGGDILDAPCLPPHRHFAYAPGRGDIAEFAVRPDGSLHSLSPSTIPVQGNAERMVYDPSGHFLYTSGVGQGGILQFRIQDNGQLVPLSPATIPLPFPVFFSEGDAPLHYLYALIAGPGIAPYRLGTDGQLTPVQPIVAYPTISLTFSQGGHFAYSTGDDNQLRSFRVGTDGRLTRIGSPLPVSGMAERPVVVPSGRFVYVPNLDDGTISQFGVKSDGSLAPINPPTINVNGRPSTLTTLRLP